MRIVFITMVVLGAALASAGCNGDGDTADAAPVADAAAADAGDGDGGGPLGFMEECDLAEDLCDDSLELFCWDYPSKGPHCTHSCEGPEECEDPSPGCSPQGVCRAP